MRKTVVGERDTLTSLSVRLGVPGCMLLRANRLYSPAWLLPGREIEVPEGGFCEADDFPCPSEALRARAFDAGRRVTALPGDDFAALAARYGACERVLRAVNAPTERLLPGMRVRLPERT